MTAKLHAAGSIWRDSAVVGAHVGSVGCYTLSRGEKTGGLCVPGTIYKRHNSIVYINVQAKQEDYTINDCCFSSET